MMDHLMITIEAIADQRGHNHIRERLDYRAQLKFISAKCLKWTVQPFTGSLLHVMDNVCLFSNHYINFIAALYTKSSTDAACSVDTQWHVISSEAVPYYIVGDKCDTLLPTLVTPNDMTLIASPKDFQLKRYLNIKSNHQLHRTESLV